MYKDGREARSCTCRVLHNNIVNRDQSGWLVAWWLRMGECVCVKEAVLQSLVSLVAVFWTKRRTEE